jgi:hypothetical protein
MGSCPVNGCGASVSPEQVSDIAPASPGTVAGRVVGHGVSAAVEKVTKKVLQSWGSCVGNGLVGGAVNAFDPAGSVVSGFVVGCGGGVTVDIVMKWNQAAGSWAVVLSAGHQSNDVLVKTGLGEGAINAFGQALRAAFFP